jgi:hypothetical protein
MYSFVLATHSIVRWLVLAVGIWAVWRVWRGWMTRAVWTDTDMKAGKLFAATVDLQFVIGVILYAVSPLIRQGLGDMGTAMRTQGTRYFMVEHVLMMLIAITLVHVGLARVRKGGSDSAKFQTATIWWGIGVAAIAGFIPWQRPLFPFA